ncbi:Uma2 family endonuclease [Lacunimicrobium album]
MTPSQIADRQRAGADPQRYRFSIEEFLKLYEVGILPPDFKAELIDGEIIELYHAVPYRFSIENYIQLYESGILHEDLRTELLDGEILCMTPPGPEHISQVYFWAKYLRRKVSAELCIITESPVKIGSDLVEPDVTVFRGPDKKLTKGFLQPSDVELLIEISNTTLRYDVVQKSRHYARFQIPQLLVVDVRQNKVTFFQQPRYDEVSGLATYEQVSTYQRSEEITVTLGETTLTFTLDQILQGE